LLIEFIDGDNYVFCPRHFDKPIEYFCKQCSITVCVKCMFDEHNGHDLIQIDEMASSLKQNVMDLQKMLVNAHRLNEEN
jgi:B-box zinc finger